MPFSRWKGAVAFAFQSYPPMCQFYCRFEHFLDTNFCIIGGRAVATWLHHYKMSCYCEYKNPWKSNTRVETTSLQALVILNIMCKSYITSNEPTTLLMFGGSCGDCIPEESFPGRYSYLINVMCCLCRGVKHQ